MQKNNRISLILVTIILGLSIIFTFTASAAPLNGFPLLTSDGILVADEFTRYITFFRQDANFIR